MLSFKNCSTFYDSKRVSMVYIWNKQGEFLRHSDPKDDVFKDEFAILDRPSSFAV